MTANYGPNSGGIFLLWRLFFSTKLLGVHSSFSNISPGIIDFKSLKSGLFSMPWSHRHFKKEVVLYIHGLKNKLGHHHCGGIHCSIANYIKDTVTWWGSLRNPLNLVSPFWTCGWPDSLWRWEAVGKKIVWYFRSARRQRLNYNTWTWTLVVSTDYLQLYLDNIVGGRDVIAELSFI